jgi:radical SAM protein with 4Fe4S-binding SPASM domain
MSRLVVLSPSGLLSDRALAHLSTHVDDRVRDLVVVGTAEELPACIQGDTRLLYVPSGTTPVAELGIQLARGAGGSAVGVLSEDEGVVLTKATADQFSRFLRADPCSQDDAGVYLAGARARERWSPGDEVPLPRQIYLGLTQRCNRSCSFCVSRSFDYDVLSVAEVRRIANESCQDVDVIALTGAGEAMVHPDFWEILDLLRETAPQATFKMNTSGIALVRNAPRLMGYPVKNITVSLNAGTATTYERVVGRGFDAALRGIDAIVRARSDAGREDLRLCISMVLMHSTVHELMELVEIAFEHGVEEIQGIYLMVNDDVLADESLWTMPEQSNRWLERAMHRAAALGVSASLPPRFGSNVLGDAAQRASLPTTQGQACVEAWSTLYIRPDGHALPCPYFERSLGSLRESSLAEVWGGEDYQQLRGALSSGELFEECRTCCGFNEHGSVDDVESHWIGVRKPPADDRRWLARA